jgi:hypothetical protein
MVLDHDADTREQFFSPTNQVEALANLEGVTLFEITQTSIWPQSAEPAVELLAVI